MPVGRKGLDIIAAYTLSQAVGVKIRGGAMADTNHVQQIRPVEQVSVDQEQLGALYHQLGEAGAEDVVCRALEEMAHRLGDCDALYSNAEWLALRKNVHALVSVAEQIGMHAVARVARDVTRCLDHGDGIAAAATLSRLIRIGERSLTAVWDLQDVPF